MIKTTAMKWVGLTVVGLVFAGWVGWRAGACGETGMGLKCPLCQGGSLFSSSTSAKAIPASFEPDQPGTSAPKADKNTNDAKSGGGSMNAATTNKTEQAIFAAGCFWGVQVAFDHVSGVSATEVGYSNGKTKNPTYKQVCKDDTGHAEVVRVTFDPAKVSFAQLCDTFFASHNPTQVNRQGPDYGDQYRTAIFYLSDAQKSAAEERKKAWQAKFKKPIATEISAAAEFYTAEDYHQKYLEKKGQTECHLPSYERSDLAEGKDKDWAPTPAPAPAGTKNDAKPEGKVSKSDAEWKKELTPEQYEVLRMKGTERAFTGKYWETKTPGTYVCAGCGAELFTSDAKFDSGCGWPSFDKAVADGRIEERVDSSHGMTRTEVVCAKCGGHLGHLFDDGPTKTGMRYCINSVSIDLKAKEEAEKAAAGKK